MVLGTNGAIIIGVLGGVLLLVLFGICLFVVQRRKARKADQCQNNITKIVVTEDQVLKPNEQNGRLQINDSLSKTDCVVQYNDSLGRNNPFRESFNLGREIQNHFNTLPRSPGQRKKFDIFFNREISSRESADTKKEEKD